MIVDDIPLMRIMLTKFVKTLGKKLFHKLESYEYIESVEIVEAPNGKVALEKLKRHPVDVIFLDLMMPEMDGLAFLEHQKNSSEFGHIPVIVCSAIGESQTRDKAEELGAKGYITKPFTLRAVEKTILSALGNKSPTASGPTN